jgi:hypothetical protein
MAKWRTVSSMATCVSLLAWPFHSALADCTKDTDCKGDRVCDEGKCVAPSAEKTKPAEKASASAADFRGDDGEATAEAAPKAAPAKKEDADADDENTGHTQRVIGIGVMVTGGICVLIGGAVAASSHKQDTQVAGAAFAGSAVAGGLIGLGIYLLAPKPKAEAYSPTLRLAVGLNRVGLGGTF